MGLKPAWEVNSPQKFNAFPVSHFQPCYSLFDPSSPSESTNPAGGEAICRLAFEGTSHHTNDCSWMQGKVIRGRGFSHEGRVISRSALNIPPGLSPHRDCLTPADALFSVFFPLAISLRSPQCRPLCSYNLVKDESW